MNIDTRSYLEEGMYLHCENGAFFDFSVSNVATLSDEYWDDTSKLAIDLRQDENFKTCSVCPYRGEDVMCSSIKPILPFLENLTDFHSFDRVTVIYRDTNHILSTQETDMQTALQYLTNMSVFQYCEDMKSYNQYFKGINPLQPFEENVQTVLLNIFWQCKGDKQQTKKVSGEVQKAIDITSRNCIKRIRLLCKNDAFMNAYVKTHAIGTFLSMSADKLAETESRYE